MSLLLASCGVGQFDEPFEYSGYKHYLGCYRGDEGLHFWLERTRLTPSRPQTPFISKIAIGKDDIFIRTKEPIWIAAEADGDGGLSASVGGTVKRLLFRRDYPAFTYRWNGQEWDFALDNTAKDMGACFGNITTDEPQ